MIWWYWILLGLVLAAIELATPGGFFVIFFAVAAVLVGLIDVAGILEADSVQWALFTVVSLASLALFRKPLLERMNRGEREGRRRFAGRRAGDRGRGDSARAARPRAAPRLDVDGQERRARDDDCR